MKPRPCLPEATRFWRHVAVGAPGDCWEWTGGTTRGYGVFWAGIRREGTARAVWAHRWAWENTVGPIPVRMQIDHLCRNPRCVNVGHLEVVTQRENILRGNGASARHARATACAHGHPWSPENVRLYRGVRHCRACARKRNSAATRARNAAECPLCHGPMRPTSRTCRRCQLYRRAEVQSMMALDMVRIAEGLK